MPSLEGVMKSKVLLYVTLLFIVSCATSGVKIIMPKQNVDISNHETVALIPHVYSAGVDSKSFSARIESELKKVGFNVISSEEIRTQLKERKMSPVMPLGDAKWMQDFFDMAKQMGIDLIIFPMTLGMGSSGTHVSISVQNTEKGAIAVTYQFRKMNQDQVSVEFAKELSILVFKK